MSKKIHTIQSSGKVEFDKKVNFFLELGCELLEGSYELIKKDDDVMYSQVVTIETDKYDVEFYENGQLQNFGSLNKDGNKVGLWTEWDWNGQKRKEETYKNGFKDGLHTSWYENGQKRQEGTHKDGKSDGLVTFWYRNGQKRGERTFKDGSSYPISEKCWDEDGNECECSEDWWKPWK